MFFVNKNNSIDNLSIKNIQDIFSGKIKYWKELNGANQRIRAFQRPENSGSQTMLEKVMGNIPVMEPRKENVSSGMGDIINQVAVYRNFTNAIGYSFLFYSTEMVNYGSYPFSDSFCAIYNDTDDKNSNIELFIEWILSSQGQGLISETGYIPIEI